MIDSQSEAAIGTWWKYPRRVCEQDTALLYCTVGVVSAEVGGS
jgi:hypothetical protein